MSLEVTRSEALWQRRDDIVARRVGDETVLVPVRSGIAAPASVFVLSEVASFLWDKLDVPSSATELAELIVDDFEVSPEQARADLEDFLKKAQERGLVARREAAP